MNPVVSNVAKLDLLVNPVVGNVAKLDVLVVTVKFEKFNFVTQLDCFQVQSPVDGKWQS